MTTTSTEQACGKKTKTTKKKKTKKTETKETKKKHRNSQPMKEALQSPSQERDDDDPQNTTKRKRSSTDPTTKTKPSSRFKEKRLAKQELYAKLPTRDENGIAYTKLQLRRMAKRVKRGLPPLMTEEEELERKRMETLERQRDQEELAGLFYSKEEEEDDNEDEQEGEEKEEEEEDEENEEESETVDENKREQVNKKPRQHEAPPSTYICPTCQNKHTPNHWAFDCPDRSTLTPWWSQPPPPTCPVCQPDKSSSSSHPSPHHPQECPAKGYSKFRKIPIPTGYICTHCQNRHTPPPHWKYFCPDNPHKSAILESSISPPDTYVCNHCHNRHTPKHWAHSCPHKSTQKPIPEGYICNACQNTHQPLHWIYNCPHKITIRGINKQRRKQQQPPQHTPKPATTTTTTTKQQPLTKKVFLSGLPFDMTIPKLIRLLRFQKRCGDVQNCKLLKYDDSGRCNGQAFVTFATEVGMEKALRLNGTLLEWDDGKEKEKEGEGKKKKKKKKALKLSVTKALSKAALKKQRGGEVDG